jgi:fatty acid amide hydrolase 2
MNHLLESSATEIARRIRTGETTSVEAVEAHIARLREVNPTLNAMVADRFDEALDEARAADRRVAAGGPDGLPPFWGVPCSIKEAFAVAGMPQTGGLLARKGHVADKDAATVARLRAAGAIPLGVTNVSELCMWMESNNTVYGRTSNAYDPTRTCGGSSGGEAAVVGAGAAPFGLGSDIGGSIRMPAFFNGVFGHKPTGGMVPATGQFPISHGAALRMLATGPICRRAEDLWPLLRILAGPDGEDDGCVPFALGDPDTVRIEGLRVLDVEDNGCVRVSDDLRDAQRRAAEALARRGARVERARVPDLKWSLPIWSSLMALAGGPSFAERLGSGVPVSAAAELVRFLLGRSAHTLPAIGLVAIERLQGTSPGMMNRFAEKGRLLREELVERIGPNGVMLYPSYPTPAPKHGKPLLPPFQWVYTAILNAMQMPSTQVPLGLNAQGLPLGVQVVAVHGRDHVSIAVARVLEEEFGGWVPPPRIG